MKYIVKQKTRGCFLCKIIKESKDEKNFIIIRTKKVISLLNLYPYVNGHIMVVPRKHTNSLENLSVEETSEVFFHINKVICALKKAFKPEGFNVGLNLGKSAGAGEDKHLHFHIVPRWQGDTNFMPVFSNTRVMPQSLEQTYTKIKKSLK